MFLNNFKVFWATKKFKIWEDMSLFAETFNALFQIFNFFVAHDTSDFKT